MTTFELTTRVKIIFLKNSYICQLLIVWVNIRNSAVKQKVPKAKEIVLKPSSMSSSGSSQCLHRDYERRAHAWFVEKDPRHERTFVVLPSASLSSGGLTSRCEIGLLSSCTFGSLANKDSRPSDLSVLLSAYDKRSSAFSSFVVFPVKSERFECL